MKKKPETKKTIFGAAEDEKEFEAVTEVEETDAEQSEEKSVAADDIQTLRDDVNGIMRKLEILTEFVRRGNMPSADAAKGRVPADRESRDRFFRRVYEQENDIKKDFSDFDFKKLYSTDEGFKADFDKFGSLYAAYLKYIAKKLTQGGARGGRSFVENGAMPSKTSGAVSTSAAGLPDREFEEYIRNIVGE